MELKNKRRSKEWRREERERENESQRGKEKRTDGSLEDTALIEYEATVTIQDLKNVHIFIF